MSTPTRRWVLAGLLGLLTLIAALGTVVGRWSHSVLLDTESWVETVGPVGTAPEVTDALSRYFTAELNDFLAPTQRLQELTPDALDPLAARAGGVIESIVETETRSFFEGETYATLWIGLNETAHSAAVAIIRDQVPFFSTAGGVVTVDLTPLLSRIVDQVVVFLREVGDAIPQVVLDRTEFDDKVAELITAYETEGLPERFSNVVVFESERLGAIQQTVSLFDRLVWVLPALTVLLAVWAVWLAPNRILMGLALLGGAVVVWLLSIWAISTIVSTVVDGVTSQQTAVVAEAVLEAITDGLLTLMIVLSIGAVAAGVGVFVWSRQSEPEESSVV